MDKPRNQTVTAKVTDDLFQEIEQACHLEHRSRSQMVYLLLVEALKARSLEPRSTRGLPGEPSSLEGAENQEPGSRKA
jgi:hypothetical protein